jgi:ubiquinone/menaquinone biosynthesis C-methylase UbiE
MRMDYQKEYDAYWSRADRWGSHSFAEAAPVAEQILALCGKEPLLDVGFGMGLLVTTLLELGVDAQGVDVARRAVSEANRAAPGRFSLGSILDLPFPDGSFPTVVSTDCLEHIAESDVPQAIAELSRVTRRHLFLRLATTPDRERRWHLTVHPRDWWEAQLFAAGFRTHPLFQTVVPFECLEDEPATLTLAFEKIPDSARAAYPLASLKAERDLHMDMLRESGRRAEAHVARYILAREYVRSGMTVLDAACGLGYGAAILGYNAPAVRVLGIDESDFAVQYARTNFASIQSNLEFLQDDVHQLKPIPSRSVDLVVSFETIEHLKHPQNFLAEVQRVLTPGGKIVCSVPNRWVDETGRDPNPWHVDVYDFPKLAELCGRSFDLERAYLQTAGGGMKLPSARRSLRRVNLPVTHLAEEAEWWILTSRQRADSVSSAPEPERVLLLTCEPDHPLFQSWTARCPWPVQTVEHYDLEAGPLKDASILVTTDHYREPAVTAIRRARERQVPTLILADGVLEYRNTWRHPQIVPGSIFQPVLGHKIACLGRSQARILESWGNHGQCEVVGSPRFDHYAGRQRRQRRAQDPFRVLVLTAKTPYFTELQHERVRHSLLDLKRFFDGHPRLEGQTVEPLWRLTQGLEREIGVRSDLKDLRGLELAGVMETVDAVIATPSTAMVEAMLLGLPVAALDYGNDPHYLACAWRITSECHVPEVLAELLDPPAAKMLFQETSLHDTLECASPSAPRLIQLIAEMIRHGRQCRREGRPLEFPVRILGDGSIEPHPRENRFHLAELYPGQEVLPEANPAALRVEVAHLRQYAAALERQCQVSAARSGPVPEGHERIYSFIRQFKHASVLKGKPEQAAVWDLTLHGQSAQALYLQSPAQLAFDIPTAEPGTFESAAALHPDVWNNPASGGCEFHVRVDERTAYVLALDPIHLPADRRWHPIKLPVPASLKGRHRIILETRSVGGSDAFRWAVWRAPAFAWRPAQSAPATSAGPALELASPQAA